MVRYADQRAIPNRILDMTSLTVDEFTQLVPAFDAAFVRHLRDWTMDGKRRVARSFTRPYANSPLPTPEDRLFFILTYVKTATRQTLQASLFGMSQPNVNRWIHVLLPVLSQTFVNLGDMPARHFDDIHARMQAICHTTPPFFIMMVLSDQLPAPKMRMNKPSIIAARKSNTR